MVQRWQGDDVALRTFEGDWSWAELHGRIGGAARWLQGRLPAGIVTPCLLSATPASYAWVLGGAAATRPLAPLGTRLTVAELAACIEPAHDTLLVDEVNAALGMEVGRSVGVDVVVLDMPPFESAVVDPLSPDDVAFVVYTSGTSGRPKPVAYQQGVAGTRAQLLCDLCGFGPDAVYATSSPFQHVAGFAGAVSALAAGSAVVPVERFSTDAWSSFSELGVTHALLVPTMIDMLLEAGVLVTSTLRSLTYGAAPMPLVTLRALLSAAPELLIVQLFGQTEGTPLTALTADDHRNARREPGLLGTVGRAVPGVELLVHEPDQDGIGELWARGRHLARSDDTDGWLHTGDLGSLDRAGRLRLHGRRADRIVRGGENVDPAEVEAVIARHPAVAEVAVVGVPDERWGQVVTAWIVPGSEGPTPDPAELRTHARQSLAGFKVPTAWHLVDSLPRNGAGKLLRRQLVTTHGSVDTGPIETDHAEQGGA
jgi:acyl-CoA synthetase (AMP-forming)/AMP-acid ligase II